MKASAKAGICLFLVCSSAIIAPIVLVDRNDTPGGTPAQASSASSISEEAPEPPKEPEAEPVASTQVSDVVCISTTDIVYHVSNACPLFPTPDKFRYTTIKNAENTYGITEPCPVCTDEDFVSLSQHDPDQHVQSASPNSGEPTQPTSDDIAATSPGSSGGSPPTSSYHFVEETVQPLDKDIIETGTGGPSVIWNLSGEDLPESEAYYWTSSGKSYHKSPDCLGLSQAKEAYRGTIEAAVANSKVDSCNICFQDASSYNVFVAPYPSPAISGSFYWTPEGKSHHDTAGCPSLSRSKNIRSGSLQDAYNAGKFDPCDRCVGG